VLHNWNRAERQVARQDVPLAKVVQTNEEEQRQKEELQRLEDLKKRFLVVTIHLPSIRSPLANDKEVLRRPIRSLFMFLSTERVEAMFTALILRVAGYRCLLANTK